ncbi:hypothetical protein [Paraburkholderia lacunae]|uniref:Uncharacterized protein n=1 Tax=Paraburkholderia lacunae TaxID=2211104 RepID=A0A370N7M2_9BURK|nr:hypothetical protein [Paraburkholderia lacunae]RDK01609.1 hypothetical protein DLM46_17565 [Paraburkholderia lacunae]
MVEKKIERHQSLGDLVISKSDAAERQLCTAIWLWFHDFDPVPIHGLACAAWKILWKLHQKHATGYKTMREVFLENVRAEYRDEVLALLSETENFIKHADRDPFSFHSFRPSTSEFILMDCVTALRAFNGRFPLEARVFYNWTLVHNPKLLANPTDAQSEALKGMQDCGSNLSKSEFYPLFAKAIAMSDENKAEDSLRTDWRSN